MTTTKARIGEIPYLLYVYFKVAWPLSIALLILYILKIQLVSEEFHRIFMVAFLLVSVLLKKFSHLLLQRVTVVFHEDRIVIDEIDMNLLFTEIEGIEFTVSGYKGEVSYGGARPAKLNGYGNILHLKLTEGGMLPLNVFIEDPNDEVALIKRFSRLPNSTIQRLR